MKVMIDIDEEDFRIMQHNVAVDNPLCPLGEKEIVTKIANGMPIPDDATNGEMIKAMFGISDDEIDEGLSTTYVYTGIRVLKGDSQDLLRKQITFNKDWWNAPYKKEVEE